MTLRNLTIVLFLATFVQGSTAASGEALQAKLLLRYFSEQLKIPGQDIELDIIHAAGIEKSLLRAGEISVQSSNQRMNLGHQTLWLVHKSGQVVKKRWPVTVDVHANLLLPIATENISRLDLMTDNRIVFEKRRVGREYRNILSERDEILGKMACQSIRAGRIIERNMLKTAPDVLMGTTLQIFIMDKGLTLELPGIAKEEGLVGEEIRVQCPTTRKEFRGTLKSPQAVIVSLR